MRKLLLTIGFLFLVLNASVLAQEDFTQSVAVPVPIEGDVQDGNLICSKDKNYSLCSEEYDSSLYGVMTQSPGAAFEVEPSEGLYLVVTSGRVVIGVTAANGAIEVGDFVTSSSTPGAAMKATQNGYVLGSALAAYNPAIAGDVGKIPVLLNIHPTTQLSSVGQNLLSVLRKGLSLASLDALSYLRYLLAAGVVIVSFVLGFIYFGRVVRTGIESLGRNPLAGRLIQLTVLFNIVLLIVIIGIGLAVAYFILVF